MAEFLHPPFVRVEHAVISTASSGDQTVQGAAGAGHRLRIVALVFVTTLAQSITLKSGGTSLSGAMPFGANSGLAWSASSMLDTLDCGDNEAFIINLGVATQTSGWIKFVTATV